MGRFRHWRHSLQRAIFGEPACSTETCLILPQSKLIYAYIPKAACTSIKTWLLRHSGECPEIAEQFNRAEQAGTKPPDAHDTIHGKYSARRYSTATVRAALRNPEYFKFTFVRHPLRRLVSAYLDKVVKAKITGLELIARGQVALSIPQTSLGGWWGQPKIDPDRSLTFREFVDVLWQVDADRVDVHFRAQHRLLRGLAFDWIGQIENLPRDFSPVQQHLQCLTPLAWKHQTEYFRPTGECVSDWPANRFRGIAAPAWQSFFDESLRSSCCELYAADFKRFGYSTDLSGRRAA